MLINLILLALFFKEFKITTFDSPFAKALGFSVIFFDYLLMTEVSLTVVGAFRAVGVLMVLSLITGPPLAARFFTKNLSSQLILSASFGVLASLFGVFTSRHLLTVYGLALSTSGIVVIWILVLFLVGVFYSRSQSFKVGNLKFLKC